MIAKLKPLALLAVLALVVGACARGDTSILDKGPRFPDAEGTVTKASLEGLTLDDQDTYKIGEEIESFSTRGHTITPLVHLEGRYVHVGLKGDTVEWVAFIGVVADRDPPQTIYAGIFQEVLKGRAVFEDGTTLAFAEGVKMPPTGKEIIVTIDPAKKVITKMQVAAGQK